MADNKNEQLELSLPFEDFTGKIGGQSYAKETYNRGNDILVFKIPFEKIEIWDGYNTRKIYNDIPELAESLLVHGQKTPFKLVLLKDGRAFLKRGGRRYKAYELLIQQGKFDKKTEVPFEYTSPKEKMEDIILDLYTSNNLQNKLLPIEQAEVAWRLKYLCGPEKTNEEIAAMMGISRQTVDNLITIASQPDDLKNEIANGQMSFTQALNLIKSQRRLDKQADKKEEESHQTSASMPSPPEDALKEDMQQLADLEGKADEYKKREENRKRQELEQLKEIAIEITIGKDSLFEQVGKKLAADAVKIEKTDFKDEDTGEILEIEARTVILSKGTEINDDTINKLVESGVNSVYIYKQNPVAESVITEPVAQEEKSKYDYAREEMDKARKAIQCADKIEAIVTKLDVPDQTKSDISYQVHWLQENLVFIRDWMHKHKPQNKR